MKHQTCYHCGSPVTDKKPPTLEVDGVLQSFCCSGCKTVTEHILNSGLKGYYEFRTDLASKVNEDNQHDDYLVYDDPAFLELITDTLDATTRRIVLTVENIHCAACAWLIEQSLVAVVGINRVNVNTISQRAEIEWNQNTVTISQIMAQLHDIGYPAAPFKISDQEQGLKQQDKTFIKRLGVAGLFTMQVMMIAFAMYFGAFENMEAHQVGYFKWLSLLLSVPVVFYSALPFLFGCFYSIKSRRLSMDVPVATAIYGAFIASSYQLVLNGLDGAHGEVYFESICMFTFLLLIGKYLEFKAKTKAVLSNANLEKNLPITLDVLNQQNEFQTKLIKDVVKGDVIRIKAGEQIAIDGLVTKGRSSVNESVLNGEFEPVTKAENDLVLAGSINNDGLLEVKVTAIGTNTTLSKISELQSKFTEHKPQYTEFADRIAHWFVLGQLVLAAITYVIWQFVSPADALWVSLSVLVATCPCALSLATPTAYTCIMSALQKLGFLIKNPKAFDKLNQITDVVFDKTGTLTQGKFVVHQTTVHAQDIATIKSVVYQLQQHSEHPIAKAFDDSWLGLDQTPLTPITDVQIKIGRGITAIWDNKRVKLGSVSFVAVDDHVPTSDNANVFLSIDNEVVAEFIVADELKPQAKQVIEHLNNLGLTIHMLTGDSSSHGKKVAEQLAITKVQTNVSAVQKANYVSHLQDNGRSVLVVGDGINDAPVFAHSDVSAAMGQGADITKYASDIILLKNSLQGVLQLLQAAKQTRDTIKYNLWSSIVYNVVILPVAMLGFVAPYIAVIGMSASSIFVVSHSLKLLKFR